jgi:hypothetical protein
MVDKKAFAAFVVKSAMGAGNFFKNVSFSTSRICRFQPSDQSASSIYP